jgi:hypothetical protein
MNPLETYPKELSEIRSSGDVGLLRSNQLPQGLAIILSFVQYKLTISGFSAYNRFG